IIISTVSTIVKVVVLVWIAMHVYRFTLQAYDFGYRVFTEEAVAVGTGIYYTVNVGEDSTAKDVAQSLEKFGLIDDWRLFMIQYMLSDYRGKLQPGSYSLSTGMTANEMLEILAGDVTEETEETEDTE
ncbi:MAG: endolytic transglycosylase MltG, partial [Lachnospiraceae bacterium]|nr:endolytic transglycosylase MltG [Lachnospiraceae bacterium]